MIQEAEMVFTINVGYTLFVSLGFDSHRLHQMLWPMCLLRQTFKIYKMEFNEIEKQLTIEQKAAITGILIVMAKADKRVVESETKFIDSIANYLNLSPFDPIHQKVASSGKAGLMKILNTLSRTQKEWLIELIYSIVIIDGVVEDIEISYVSGISEEIGISESEFVGIINNKIYEGMIKKMKGY